MSDLVQSPKAGNPAFKRLLGIDTPLGPGKVVLVSLEGDDGLSRCFLYRVRIVAEDHDTDPHALLGQTVTLWLNDHDPEQRRPIHGLVRRVVGRHYDLHGHRQFEMEVVPRFWLLSCSEDCRIFQDMTVPDILDQIFKDQEFTDYDIRVVRREYPKLHYCVQYQESALAFVSRLMEHLGLFYWHEHSDRAHRLVIADRNAATTACYAQPMRPPRYHNTEQLVSLDVDCSFRPGRWTLNDYDFEDPTKQLLVGTGTLATVPRMAKHEIYGYPGYYEDRKSGERITRTRIEYEESRQHTVFGVSHLCAFDPGRQFSVAAVNGPPARYLLTEVRHHATSAGLEASETTESYSNEYVAIPAGVPYRPERVTPRPYMRGSQTAVVVGPAGENIHCDAYGRVRVQFHWDRRGRRGENSSCWMRVAQARAGSNYGSLVIPHVGHEVIVSFMEGDPDRPLITGTVPNALTMPPVELPLDKNKTVQRDHGDNKIVMHGKAGRESLHLVSPRAVNLFASGRTARPLSAGLNFSPNPTNNAGTFGNSSGTVTPTWSAGVPSTGSGTASDPLIDNFKDELGLKEVHDEWFGTVLSDIGLSSNTGSTSTSTVAGAGQVTGTGSYGVQDGTSKNSYLNWGSEGKINCVVLDNNNLWVWGNSNSWINGDANTKINGNSDTTIGGRTFGGKNDAVTVTTKIFGNNSSLIFGANESVIMGLNTALNVSPSLALNMGLAATINLGLFVTQSGIAISQTMLQLSKVSVNVKTADAVEVTTFGAGLTQCGIKVIL